MKFIYSNGKDIGINLLIFFAICYFGSSIDSLRQSKNQLEPVFPIQGNNAYYNSAYPYYEYQFLPRIPTYQTFDQHNKNWRIDLCKDIMIGVRTLFHWIAKIPNFNLEFVNTLYFYLLPILLCSLLLLCTTSFTLVMSVVMFIISVYICFGNKFNKKLPSSVFTYLFPCVSLFLMCLIQDYENETTISKWIFKLFTGFLYSTYGWWLMFVNMICLFGISCYTILYFMSVLVFSPFLIKDSRMNMLKSLYKHKLSLIFVFILLTLRSSIAKLNSIKNPYKNYIIGAEIICGIFMLYYFNKKINSN